MKRLICWFKGHDWYFNERTHFPPYPVCVRCGAKQDSRGSRWTT